MDNRYFGFGVYLMYKKFLPVSTFLIGNFFIKPQSTFLKIALMRICAHSLEVDVLLSSGELMEL